jgi:hypothetical protein
MSLLELQRDMLGWLADGSEDAADLIAMAAADDRAARVGLAIYQNNYRAQLVACLSEGFERVRLWIGEEAFALAAATHIDRTPPTGWTLDAYGADFPETLAGLYPGDPEIVELARLDRALADAFVGSDSAVVDPMALASVDWDGARLTWVPSLRVDVITTNAPEIWSALSAGAMPPAAASLPDPARLLIWRQDFVACFRPIDRAERLALVRIGAGESFGMVCAALVEAHGVDEGIALASGMLSRWIADGLIAAVA